MKVIYEPTGKAREYSELAANLYTGCTHGCLYCYAPSAQQKPKAAFHGNVAPRKDVLRHLARDAGKFSGREVLLCFTCDPYQPCELEHGITREAIATLHARGITANVLTKGGRRSARDLDLLSARPELSLYGATLTFTEAEDSRKWEPQAAPPVERLEVLREAKHLGVRTWASLEPVISPEQSLEIIRMTRGFVDVFKVGRWNHDARANEIEWRVFAKTAVELLERYGLRYYIKKDLAVFLQ